ncbi:MAG: GNAT family N-acetyltransferase [Anaerolineales bacterium]|nr:GNAT family N-acetyltransferase [Anaerolineales bacterium]
MNTLPGITLKLLHPAELEARTLSDWADLEARASMPNAFLSPYFVLPALRHLDAQENVFGAFIERHSAGNSTLIGVALFRHKKPSRHFPLPHLTAYASVHSYLTGFLLDADYVEETSQMLARFLKSNSYRWHGAHFENCPHELMLRQETLTAFSSFGLRWRPTANWQRPVLRPGQDNISALPQISRHSLKDYQRHMRHLQSLGRFEWKARRAQEPVEKSLEEFLKLENMGWKGQKKSSLVSNPNDLRFFKEMSAAFHGAGRLFLTEIHLNGNIIASTVNLISGRAGFGFKLGWDTRYAKHSPGIVNLAQIMEHAEEAFSDLEYIDSSASPNSYVSKIWPARRNLADGWLTLSPLGNAALTSIQLAQKFKAALSSSTTRSNMYRHLQAVQSI